MAIKSSAFPRSSRLISPKDYSRVFADARKSADRYFTILYRRQALPRARLGLAISKKCLKRAVDRNRIKRIVRESFRRHQYSFPGIDIVVLARRGIPVNDKLRLHAALEKHWLRLCSNKAPGGEAR